MMAGVNPGPGVGPLAEVDPSALPTAPAQPFENGWAAANGIVGPHGARPAALALRLRDRRSDLFEIAVTDAADAAILMLGPFADDEVIAIWRSLGASSGLPLTIERADGTIERPYPQLGRVELGSIRIRRRHGLLSGRRPRFLVRRKTGRPALRPRVHREREIAGGVRA